MGIYYMKSLSDEVDFSKWKIIIYKIRDDLYKLRYAFANNCIQLYKYIVETLIRQINVEELHRYGD